MANALHAGDMSNLMRARTAVNPAPSPTNGKAMVCQLQFQGPPPGAFPPARTER